MCLFKETWMTLNILVNTWHIPNEWGLSWIVSPGAACQDWHSMCVRLHVTVCDWRYAHSFFVWLCLDWNPTPCPVPGSYFDSVVIASRTRWLNKSDIAPQVCCTPPTVDLWPFGHHRITMKPCSVFVLFHPVVCVCVCVSHWMSLLSATT